jgi:hypothetical protein
VKSKDIPCGFAESSIGVEKFATDFKRVLPPYPDAIIYRHQGQSPETERPIVTFNEFIEVRSSLDRRGKRWA